MARSQKTTAKRTRPAGQRDLIRHGSGSAYAKRTATGQFTELDDLGRSQKADRRVGFVGSQLPRCTSFVPRSRSFESF
jgi:hypothetical protein